MIRSKQDDYLFVSTPKTGTHTLYDVLVKQFDGVQLDGQYHRREIPDDMKDGYTFFTTVRNPYERVVSAWNSLLFQDSYRPMYLDLTGGDRFEDFVNWVVKQPNDKILVGRGMFTITTQSAWLKAFKLDYYLPIESIEDSFAMLPFVSKDFYMPRLLHREHRSNRELVVGEIKEKLRKWLKPDFEMLKEFYNP